MLVIKIFSERKKVFRERKKCEKIRAKRFDFLQGMERYLSAGNPTVTGGGEEYKRRLFEIGESRGNLLEDDIENLKRSERFRSEYVIEMNKNDDHIYIGILGKAWYWRMQILRSVLFRKERMAGPEENRVKVAEKEETRKSHSSPDGGP
nr:hypothetical protein [Tanacetum cinerariifolium]